MKLFHQLDPETDNGRKVRIGDRTGKLCWAQNPQYRRIDAHEWYLLIEDKRFGEVAMSTYTIQPFAVVDFLEA